MNTLALRIFLDALKSDVMVQAVVAVLLLMSVFSWALFFYKFLYLKSIRKKELELYALVEEGATLKGLLQRKRYLKFSPFLVFLESFETARSKVSDPKSVVEAVELMVHTELYRWVPFFATVGNVAPFIGLFGTVWGIMKAFHMIGLRGSANLAVVAPGISEALVNTALGLFVAIPAVMFYNYFTSKIESIINDFKAYALIFAEMNRNEAEKDSI